MLDRIKVRLLAALVTVAFGLSLALHFQPAGGIDAVELRIAELVQIRLVRGDVARVDGGL